MKRKLWKRVLAVACMASLCMSAPGVVMASEEQRQERAIDGDIAMSMDGECISISDESCEIIEENASTEDVGVSELENHSVEDMEDYADTSSNIEMDEPDVGDTEELDKDSPLWIEDAKIDKSEIIEQFGDAEDTIGETLRYELFTETYGPYVVGDNVTAKIELKNVRWYGSIPYHPQDYSYDPAWDIYTLYFDSRGGTLWRDWQAVLKEDFYHKNYSDIFGFYFCFIKFTDNSTKMYLPEDSSFLFRDITFCGEHDFGIIDVHGVKFGHDGCEFELDKVDTSKVTNMEGMFEGNGYLTSLDISSFDTSNVTNMKGMFYNCESLTNLDLSNFDTSNVSDMDYMFSGCSSLKNLDISGFITPPVSWYVDDMLDDCYALERIKTPKQNRCVINLPITMYDKSGKEYNSIPIMNKSIVLTKSRPPESVDLSTFVITLSPTSYTYNGKARKPTVTVKNGSTILTLGTDYTVNYANNTNAGTATAKVTGTGNYKGEYTAKYTIKKADPKLAFANESVTKSALDKTFTNALTKATDASVTYKSSDTGVAEVDSSKGTVTIKGAGMATITANAAEGNNYKAGSASYNLKVTAMSIAAASVAGVSLSYGYSGKAYTPALTIKVNGVTLVKDVDYTTKYANNKNPGTATITITGKGRYTGTRVKTFEIVDCVSSLVSGRTYQLIPKNNSKTAVCSYSGKMVNNTKVYITDRSGSEAMKFKAVKNKDGSWKFINSKCELALAVQQNSTEVGKGLVLYDQTTKPAQNWKLSKKSDNSFAIINAVTGYSIAMSDASAVKGTTLSMAETASSGLQRFYIAETSAVDAPFDGTYAVKASKDTNFALSIASSSKEDGANVNLYSYTNTNDKKFKILYSGGGYYRLSNVNSGLCLTVNGNSNSDGANIIQSKWTAQSGQRWKITKNSDGTVTMTNVLGTVLHLTGNKTANGTNVVAKKSSTTTAQKWYLQ